LVQGLRQVPSVPGRTETRQVSSAPDRPGTVPVQPWPFTGGGSAPNRVGAPRDRPAPNHLRLDLGLPINHYLPPVPRRTRPRVRPEDAEGADARSPPGL